MRSMAALWMMNSAIALQLTSIGLERGRVDMLRADRAKITLALTAGI